MLNSQRKGQQQNELGQQQEERHVSRVGPAISAPYMECIPLVPNKIDQIERVGENETLIEGCNSPSRDGLWSMIFP
jgi:hypothetical protein